MARSTSAVALQSLAPQEFDSLAKTIVADDDDDDGVRATMLNALAHDPDDPDDPTLGVARAINESGQRSPQLKAAARDDLRQSTPFLQMPPTNWSTQLHEGSVAMPAAAPRPPFGCGDGAGRVR